MATAHWREGLARPGPYARLRLVALTEFVWYVARRARADNLLTVASALAYTSLLALVPLLAIALAMLAAFPVFTPVRQQIQDFIFHNFVPAVGAAVQSQVAAFVDNAGSLTAVGVVGLAVTAIMLLVTIESALNMVFRVATARSAVSRLVVYWTLLTLGPLLVGASFSLSGYVMAVSHLNVGDGPAGIGGLATRYLPTVLVMLAFALVYYAVPNRPVRGVHALIGGILAGLIFALLRLGFAIYVANARTYESIYGALSAVPIFLVWTYASWGVVLVGAEVTAALPEWNRGHHDGTVAVPPRRRLTLALEVLACLHDSARLGGGGASRRTILDRIQIDEAPLLAVLGRLCQAGWATAAAGERFVLARDLDAVTLADLVRDLDLGIEADQCPLPAHLPWRERAETAIRAAAAGHQETLGMTVKELFREGES